MEAVLSSEILRKNLRTRIIGRELFVFPLVTSTNDVIWEFADRGMPEGTVVFAEEQTSGRGRMGRNWWSARGKGIWMSALLHPPKRKNAFGTISATTIVGAIATAEAISAVTKLKALIRWPNDIFMHDKKLGGVLVEERVRAGAREVVLGIGINANAATDDMPAEIRKLATSLSAETGGAVDRAALARALLRALDRWYLAKLDGDYESINARWQELSSTLGRRIVIEERGRRYEGTVIDHDIRHGLALRLNSGPIRHFRSEHVSVIEHG